MVETNPFIIEGYFSLCDKFLEQSLKEKKIDFCLERKQRKSVQATTKKVV